jgi:hypothetical protein
MFKTTGNIVENQKQIATIDPRYTLEYFLEGFLKVWTMQDITTFQLNEERFGTDVAVDMYAEMWRRRCVGEFADCKAFIGLKYDDPVTIENFADMVVCYFNSFGNPAELVKKGPDVWEINCYDCPYTTQIAWKELSREEADHFNEAVQVACNTAIFEEWLRQAKLDKDYLFSFANQLCRYGGSCGFVFRKKVKP